MSPLSNRVNVGEEPFVVVVAQGEGDVGDLYAIPASGGVAWQITFSRVDESHPALTNDGSVIAFIRSSQKKDVQPVVVLMNLLNGAERRVEMPEGAGPERVGWSSDQTRIYVRTPKGVYVIPAPPAAQAVAPIVAADSASADSALSVLLGTPAFARAATCRGGSGLCAESDSGESVIDSNGVDPVRWGSDSVAYLSRNELQVLSLGGGHTRDVRLAKPLKGLRQPAYSEGRK